MSEEAKARLGARIREARERSGRTQDDFAQAAGYDRNYWGRLERGLQNPTLTTLIRIADVLGITVSELVADVEGGHG